MLNNYPGYFTDTQKDKLKSSGFIFKKFTCDYVNSNLAYRNIYHKTVDLVFSASSDKGFIFEVPSLGINIVSEGFETCFEKFLYLMEGGETPILQSLRVSVLKSLS